MTNTSNTSTDLDHPNRVKALRGLLLLAIVAIANGSHLRSGFATAGTSR